MDVLLQLDTDRGIVVVPSPAVTLGQRGAQVWVVKADGQVDLRSVKTGRMVNQETIIHEGVNEGDRVVVTGQNRLLPSSKVVEKAPDKPATEKPALESAKGGQS